MSDTESWPGAARRLVPDDHAHALGTITVYYNHMEQAIVYLLRTLLNTSSRLANALHFYLNNKARVDLLRELAADEKDEKVKDHLLHCIRSFEICVENRNILMHAIIEETEKAAGGIGASKRASGDPHREVHFDLPLSTLRQTAEDIADTYVFILGVHLHLEERLRPLVGLAVKAWGRPAPLPQKPLQPRKLNPRLPPAVR